MKLTIERVSNGFITKGEQTEVHAEGGDSELEALQSLLYSVLEWAGYYGSKHDAQRLFVRIEKQNEDD